MFAASFEMLPSPDSASICTNELRIHQSVRHLDPRRDNTSILTNVTALITNSNRTPRHVAVGHVIDAPSERQGIRIQPDFFGPYYDRGRDKYAKGDFSQAIKVWLDFAQACSARATVKQRKGDSKGAIADRKKARQLNPNVKIFKSTDNLD